MSFKNVRYFAGTIIQVPLKNYKYSNMLVLNDIYEDSDEIICILVDNHFKFDSSVLFTIPNDNYVVSPYYVHSTVISKIIQEVKERDYSYDTTSIDGKKKLMNSLNYR